MTQSYLLCLWTDVRRLRKLVHAVGDDFRHLHHLLAQRRVFRYVGYNAIAIALQPPPQRLKRTDEVVDFDRRGFHYPAQQVTEIVGRCVAPILDLAKSGGAVTAQFANILVNFHRE
jgi:hypothetical protein